MKRFKVLGPSDDDFDKIVGWFDTKEDAANWAALHYPGEKLFNVEIIDTLYGEQNMKLTIDTMTESVQYWILNGMDVEYALDAGALLLQYLNTTTEEE